MFFNKNHTVFLIILLIFMYAFCFNLNRAFGSTINSSIQQSPNKIILIDPGHGGMDGGTISKRGTLEKDINLSIALKLKNKLAQYGYIIVMSRESDIGLYNSTKQVSRMKFEDLNNRCNLKLISNCDLFISIHQNDFPSSRYFGAQVWYSKSLESKQLAEIIQRNLREDLKNDNKREEKCAGNDYKILRCNLNIPSVIVECGFLSNYKEEIQLKDENYQQIIAESIAKSINEFFSQTKSN